MKKMDILDYPTMDEINELEHLEVQNLRGNLRKQDVAELKRLRVNAKRSEWVSSKTSGAEDNDWACKLNRDEFETIT